MNNINSMKEKKALVEAALFMSSNPLTMKDLSRITGLASEQKLKDIIDELKEDYEHPQKGFELAMLGDSYHFRVKQPYLDKVAMLTPHADLSDGMLRTLGLVALKQPVNQSYIVKVQGNKTYDYVKNLEKRGLIKTQKSGRSKIITTTKEFEKYFGRSIEEIKNSLENVMESGQPRDNHSSEAVEETGELEDTED